jgi:hypothetical protein
MLLLKVFAKALVYTKEKEKQGGCMVANIVNGSTFHCKKGSEVCKCIEL